jgi:hypothetical protein
MAYSGITQEDSIKNLMSVLNSSTTFDPAFWLDENLSLLERDNVRGLARGDSRCIERVRICRCERWLRDCDR